MSIYKHTFFARIKLLLIIIIIISLIVCAKYFHIKELLYMALLWVKNLGYLAPIAFILIYNLATVLLIPGSILTLGGGVLFGFIAGSIYVLIAATLGAIFAFLIGRYLSRDWVYQQMETHPKFKAIEAAVAKEGLKIVFLTRLSPLFPFNLLNYAFGITQISIKDYILGSFGMIPGTMMYVYIGSLARDITKMNMENMPITSTTQIAQLLIRGLGLISTIILTFYLARVAKKALDITIDN